jgi:hypothetical protein
MLSVKLVMLICGRPIASVTPLLMPKSAGFKSAFGVNEMLMRLKPKRASLTRAGVNVCVSLKVRIWRRDRRVSPKPGTVLPCSVGSPRKSRCTA